MTIRMLDVESHDFGKVVRTVRIMASRNGSSRGKKLRQGSGTGVVFYDDSQHATASP